MARSGICELNAEQRKILEGETEDGSLIAGSKEGGEFYPIKIMAVKYC